MLGGAALCLAGGLLNARQFAFSWLLSFMFFLSLGLGALFLVMMHHLFDAGWSVPIRRSCEHLANLLFPWMALLFLPLGFLARQLYGWMSADPRLEHALAAKEPWFTMKLFYLVSAGCFLVWWLLTNRLSYWSFRQDQTGEAEPTYRMRFFSAIGVPLFALTLTLAAILWMMALQYQWYSTMYGVYFYAGSVWVALATVYVLTRVLHRQGALAEVIHERQYYFLGSLLLAFTVFYAYIHFAQYFIIWNGNMPDETFWYVLREKGTWWDVGLVIIFGHFFLPFLALLRIDVKYRFALMIPLCLWCWLMHWVDLAFNIMPVLHPDGFAWRWLWLDAGCFAFMTGLLSEVFLRKYARHAPYPVRDPRLMEAMDLHPLAPAHLPAGEPGPSDELADAPPQFRGGEQ
jgi:hypothetical protein